ncbi:outer membrane protein TolC [Hydrogenivirga caldilitoris]|uniref:Outer membrane protein TolC n=1 Tax=Hydrogenivirga caldilitoris TaxID=246264 RepID=A0A497XNW9_9AQUI|nr:TolC family protein [Hydrogenivirga caldilitoris]RLJ70568.1 outer membrane protein TolC [Hydrogenivirga caldilitoris]
MGLILLLILMTLTFAQELTLYRVLEDTLKNNLEIKALKHELSAYEREYLSAKGALFPSIKLEEVFTRTDVASYVLFTKLNQERVTPADFTPSTLNNPRPVNNFETKLSLEVPLWLGGKVRAIKNASLYRKKAEEKSYLRKEEEVLFKAYETYLQASLAKSALDVSEKNLEDAKEHLKLAERLHEVGMALLSDVLRAELSLKKSEEKLKEAQNNYKLALKAIELIANTTYTDYQVPALNACPSIDLKELKEQALNKREDLRSMEDYVRVYREQYRASLSDNLPQLIAFASYSLYDRDTPFGSDGSGYMLGVSLSWSFNTGLSPLQRAMSFKDRERALLERRELLKKAIVFAVEKAFSEYETALSSLESARKRLETAQEVVRVLIVRYENGLARVVDLLDAQTQLENARFDYIQALYSCNLSYGKALLEAGMIKEVLK